MVWVKRLAPFILIVLGWFGYRWVQDYRLNRYIEKREHLALTTAKIWVATATFRDEPQRYIHYRDSILEMENVRAEDMFGFIGEFRKRPEVYLPFTRRVQYYVDSLVGVEERSIRDSRIKGADSIRAADSVVLQ